MQPFSRQISVIAGDGVDLFEGKNPPSSLLGGGVKKIKQARTARCSDYGFPVLTVTQLEQVVPPIVVVVVGTLSVERIPTTPSLGTLVFVLVSFTGLTVTGSDCDQSWVGVL